MPNIRSSSAAFQQGESISFTMPQRPLPARLARQPPMPGCPSKSTSISAPSAPPEGVSRTIVMPGQPRGPAAAIRTATRPVRIEGATSRLRANSGQRSNGLVLSIECSRAHFAQTSSGEDELSYPPRLPTQSRLRFFGSSASSHTASGVSSLEITGDRFADAAPRRSPATALHVSREWVARGGSYGICGNSF